MFSKCEDREATMLVLKVKVKNREGLCLMWINEMIDCYMGGLVVPPES